MTAPYAPAQGGFRELGGGYIPGGSDNPQAQQQQQPQAPMPRGMQQFQEAPQAGLPPQMQVPQPAGYVDPRQLPQTPTPQIPAFDVPRQQQPLPPVQLPHGQQQQMPQVQQPQALDPNTRLYGPQYPQELQGRTLGEISQIYSGLRNVSTELLQRAEQQRALQQQAPTVQQQAPQNGQQQQAAEWDWRNPRAAIRDEVKQAVAATLQETVVPMLAPMAAQNGISAINSARAAAAAEFGPIWPQIEATVMQQLQGADPQALMNPQTWQVAGNAVYGAMSRRGLLHQNGNGNGQQRPGAYPVQQVQPGQNPLPGLNTFYSEAPTQGAPVQNVQLSPMQEWARQAMGMSVADYVAWSGGIGGGR